MQSKLTDRKIRTFSEPRRYSDGGGLYLEIKPSGSRSWLFMWTVDGRRRAIGLGAYPAVSLADARNKAIDLRRANAAGDDPRKVGRKVKKPTFGQVADEFLPLNSKPWRSAKHRDQWSYTLSRRRDGDGNVIDGGYCGLIVDKPIDKITTEDILAVLEPIWLVKPETAKRTRERIERVFAYAKAKGLRTGDNPALGRGHLFNLLPPHKKLPRGHHAAMPYASVPEFIERLRDRPAVSARALEFTILTAARSGEVYGARWPEIDFENKIWTVPAARMKAARGHRVPLSKRALEILRELHHARLSDDGFVFAGQKVGKPLSTNAMDALLQERMKFPQYTVHGFRASFKDWATDETHHQREIIEAALAHVVGDKAEQAYRRTDALEKRRHLMEHWADHLDSAVENVIAFTRGSTAA